MSWSCENVRTSRICRNIYQADQILLYRELFYSFELTFITFLFFLGLNIFTTYTISSSRYFLKRQTFDSISNNVHVSGLHRHFYNINKVRKDYFTEFETADSSRQSWRAFKLHRCCSQYTLHGVCATRQGYIGKTLCIPQPSRLARAVSLILKNFSSSKYKCYSSLKTIY